MMCRYILHIYAKRSVAHIMSREDERAQHCAARIPHFHERKGMQLERYATTDNATLRYRVCCLFETL